MWVKNLLKAGSSKPLPLINVETEGSLEEAKAKMDLFSSGIAIVYSGADVLGVIKSSDVESYLKIGAEKPIKTVADLVGANFISAHPEQELKDCLLTMQYNQLRRLPVIEDGFPVGILEFQEIVTALAEKSQRGLKGRALIPYPLVGIENLKTKQKHFA